MYGWIQSLLGLKPRSVLEEEKNILENTVDAQSKVLEQLSEQLQEAQRINERLDKRLQDVKAQNKELQKITRHNASHRTKHYDHKTELIQLLEDYIKADEKPRRPSSNGTKQRVRDRLESIKEDTRENPVTP